MLTHFVNGLCPVVTYGVCPKEVQCSIWKLKIRDHILWIRSEYVWYCQTKLLKGAKLFQLQIA